MIHFHDSFMIAIKEKIGVKKATEKRSEEIGDKEDLMSWEG